MKRRTFLEKTNELKLNLDRFEAITLFEITQLYGSSLCAFLIFLLSLPLWIFSTLWVSLPICFLIIALASLLLFDEPLWLFDTHKKLKVASSFLEGVCRVLTTCLEKLRVWIARAPFYEQYYSVFRVLNPLLLLIGAFEVGFIQSPHTSTFTVMSLSLISLGSFSDDGYICLAGYLFFLFGLKWSLNKKDQKDKRTKGTKRT